MKFLWIVLFLISCSKSNEIKNYYPHLKWAEQFKGQEVNVDKEFQQKNVSGMKLSFGGKLKGHYLISEMMVDIDPEKAASLFKNKSLLIKGLYSIQATPYTGTITKEAGCFAEINLEQAIKETKNQISLQFDLKATERLVLGVCIEEQNVYRNQTLMIYCKNINTFYELKYFYPKNQQPLKQPIAACF